MKITTQLERASAMLRVGEIVDVGRRGPVSDDLQREFDGLMGAVEAFDGPRSTKPTGSIYRDPTYLDALRSSLATGRAKG